MHEHIKAEIFFNFRRKLASTFHFEIGSMNSSLVLPKVIIHSDDTLSIRRIDGFFHDENPSFLAQTIRYQALVATELLDPQVKSKITWKYVNFVSTMEMQSIKTFYCQKMCSYRIKCNQNEHERFQENGMVQPSVRNSFRGNFHSKMLLCMFAVEI